MAGSDLPARQVSELLQAHRPQVIGYALRLCVDRDDAEDAAQETLLALAHSVGSARRVAKLSGWLFAVVKSHCLRLGRRTLRQMVSLEAAEDHPAPEPFADELLRQRLAKVIASLDPDHREILVRRDLLGETAAEVSDALGLSLPAGKSRLHRARAELRQRLLSTLGDER